MMKLWHRFVILAFAMLLWTLGNASPAAELSQESIQLAMEAAGVIAPEKEVIVRVSTDLSTLRLSDPILERIHAKPQWSLNRLIVGFDEEGKELLQNDQYDFWNKLNKQYGVTQKNTRLLPSLGVITLTFSRPLHIPLLASEYSRLPHVRYTEIDSVVGDGSDICLSIQAEVHYYIFDEASGDCPSGCIQHHYRAYRVDQNGRTEALGEWLNSSREPEPQWLKNLSQCRKWL